MFKIEKGVALPAHGQMTGMTATIQLMSVGDSFLVPCHKEKARGQQAVALFAAKRVGVKITTRAVEGGIRVWLMEKGGDDDSV